MIMPRVPERMPEPPPVSRLDAIRLAAEIARPAVRLVVIATAVLLVSLMYRLGVSAEPGAARAWGVALLGLALLGLVELLPRPRARGSAQARRERADWSDRVLVESARRWAGGVAVLAMASLALLVAATAAAPAVSLLQCGVAIGGVLAARSVLLFAPAPAAASVSRVMPKHLSFEYDASTWREHERHLDPEAGGRAV